MKSKNLKLVSLADYLYRNDIQEGITKWKIQNTKCLLAQPMMT